MTNDMLSLPKETTAQQALSLRDLLIADEDSRLEEVMNPYLVTINPLEKAQKAALRVTQSELAALPVTTPEGKLLGVITVDTAIGIVASITGYRETLRLFS